MTCREEMICRLLERAGRCRPNRAFGRTSRQARADMALAGDRRIRIEGAQSATRRAVCRVDAMMEEITRLDRMILYLASALEAVLSSVQKTDYASSENKEGVNGYEQSDSDRQPDA